MVHQNWSFIDAINVNYIKNYLQLRGPRLENNNKRSFLKLV